jgi:hypothetical protein
MLLDLVVIGLVVRLLIEAAKSRLGSSPEGSSRAWLEQPKPSS